MQRQGASAGEACDNFWIADYRGLITAERQDLSDTVAPFARQPGGGDSEGEALADIVRRVRCSLWRHDLSVKCPASAGLMGVLSVALLLWQPFEGQPGSVRPRAKPCRSGAPGALMCRGTAKIASCLGSIVLCQRPIILFGNVVHCSSTSPPYVCLLCYR